MAGQWFTTQIRVRGVTHGYLAGQAAKSGITITQAAGAILDEAARQGWQVGPVTVTRYPAVVTPPGRGSAG